jgi:hypothetical protein
MLEAVDQRFGTEEVPPALQQVSAVWVRCGGGWVMECVQILACVAEAVAETKVR